MITLTDRAGNIVWQESANKVVLDDNFEQPSDSDLSSYTCVLNKYATNTSVIRVGQMLFVKDGNKLRSFELMTVRQTKDEIELYAIDVGVDLNNENIEPYKADNSYPISHYLNRFLLNSGWEIGVNEVMARSRKLEWEGSSKTVQRLHELAKHFDAFVEYEYVLGDVKILRKLVHVRKKRDDANSIRLVHGREVKGITKEESIMELATAIMAKGADDITLKGYRVPNGDVNIWHIDSKGCLIHKPSNREWHRHNNQNSIEDWQSHIAMEYTSTAKTQKTLYDECKNQLLKRNHRKLEYTVEVESLPERVRKGDKVLVVDHDFKPPLAVDAIVTAIKNVSFVDESQGTIVISNITENKTAFDYSIQNVKNLLKFQESNWNNTPFVLTIESTNGAVFQNSNVSTVLNAKVTKNDVDVTSQFTRFTWSKISRYDTTNDAMFQKETSAIEITNEDVDRQAQFICRAYIGDEEKATGSIVIKDISMTVYSGTTPPEHATSGTVWIDTTGGNETHKIFLNNKWQLVNKQKEYDKNLIINQNATIGYLTQPYAISKENNETFNAITSDFIEVTPNEKLTFQVWRNFITSGTTWRAWQFLEADKQTPVEACHIHETTHESGHSVTNDVIVVPVGASYIRISAKLYNNGYMQLERGEIATPYEMTMTDKLSNINSAITKQSQEIMLQNERIEQLRLQEAFDVATRLKLEHDKWVAELENDRQNFNENLSISQQRVALIEHNLGQYAQQLNFITRQIKMSEEGISISKENAPTSMMIDNDGWKIFSNGHAISWVHGDSFYIERGVFTKSIQIGRYRMEQYDIDKDMNVLRYIGGA